MIQRMGKRVITLDRGRVVGGAPLPGLSAAP
jgi:hypothetical protein